MTTPNLAILIVDDEEILRRNVQGFLEDEGFEVETVDSAEAGLKKLDGSCFDISIVDIRLPNMDGNAYIRNAHLHCPRMKYLIFTGSTNYQLPEEFHSLGITDKDIFRKPLINLSNLASRLKKLGPENSHE